jgi:hypothetical protein
MLSSLQDNTVNAVLVKRKDSSCPPDTVTFGNSQNNGSDGLPAIIGVHENSVTIFGKPLVTCLATQQMSFVLAIACTGGDVSTSPDSMIPAVRIRTKAISKIHHSIPLSDKVS